MNLTSLDSFGSCESIYVHLNTTEVENYEENHFEDEKNIKLAQHCSMKPHHERS